MFVIACQPGNSGKEGSFELSAPGHFLWIIHYLHILPGSSYMYVTDGL